MKKQILGLIAIAVILITSCKKSNTKPDVIYIDNPTTVHDTVKTNMTVYDTVTVVGMNLIGIWKVYQTETVMNNNSTFSYNLSYKYSFTSTKLLQDLDNNGTYELSYNATYGTSYVDIYYTTTPKTHAISTVGKEYRLTTTDPSNNTVIYYLKK